MYNSIVCLTIESTLKSKIDPAVMLIKDLLYTTTYVHVITDDGAPSISW